jgi:hypothetical protein
LVTDARLVRASSGRYKIEVRFLTASCVAAAVLTCSIARADDRPPEPDVLPRETPMQGGIFQARSSAGAPIGGSVPLAMGRIDRVIRAELVPIRLDLGYRIPHFYVGAFAQKSHEKTSDTQLTTTSRPATSCTATDFELGVTAEYHFTPEAFVQPWTGIFAARRSMLFTSDDAQSVRFKGPELGLTGGVDLRVMQRLLIGGFANASYSPLSVSLDDNSAPIDSHAKVFWFGAGLRVSLLL